MIDLGLPDSPTPAWLVSVDPSKMQEAPFPLKDLLADSLYYPACGLDGDPVKHLSRWFHSFVYCYYHYSREMFLTGLRDRPFRGYHVLGTRQVVADELAPNGWTQPWLSKGEREQVKRYADERARTPFREWVVLERDLDAPLGHGPERLSLLYLNADGVAAYRALYGANGLTARAVAVIQPGHAFGGNWTDFTDSKAPLARVVMTNSAGVPDFHISGGMGPKRLQYHQWPQYSNQLGWYAYRDLGSVGAWARARA